MSPITLVVPPDHPTRLDQYLSHQNIAPSRSQIEKWIKEGFVTVNGSKSKSSHKIQVGDVIEVTTPPVKPTELIPEALPLNIIFEDENLIVLNKSSDMVVHPGAGHDAGTLVHALLSHCHGLSAIGGVERPGIVHRLDKGTSGLMVVAKNDKAHLELARQFQEHEVRKIYWAMVYGVPKFKEQTIESNIGRSTSDRKKFAVNDNGRAAETSYRVLKEGSGLSLLEVEIKTGRTHQIRVHLTDLGHGLVGDPLYGGHARRVKALSATFRKALLSLGHPLLHAKRLSFVHPVTGRKMEFEAPLPEDFEKIRDLI